jgi:hypothetical protein
MSQLVNLVPTLAELYEDFVTPVFSNPIIHEILLFSIDKSPF